MKKNKEIAELTLGELTARRRELKDEMHHLRLQQSTEQLENSARIRTVRRNIARIETAFAAKATATKA